MLRGPAIWELAQDIARNAMVPAPDHGAAVLTALRQYGGQRPVLGVGALLRWMGPNRASLLFGAVTARRSLSHFRRLPAVGPEGVAVVRTQVQ